MSRYFYAVFTRAFRAPKFRHLSESAKLTLFYAWAVAGEATPEATWRSIDELADELDLYGRTQADIEELVRTGWLDQLEGGEVGVHDWDEWQVAANQTVQKAYEAKRKGEWRRTRETRRTRSQPDAHTSGQAEEQRRDETREEKKDQNRQVRDMSGTTPTGSTSEKLNGEHGFPPEWTDVLEAWKERFESLPGRLARAMLWGEGETTGAVRVYPQGSAVWVRDAPPNATESVVVDYVLARYKAESATP